MTEFLFVLSLMLLAFPVSSFKRFVKSDICFLGGMKILTTLPETLAASSLLKSFFILKISMAMRFYSLSLSNGYIC